MRNGRECWASPEDARQQILEHREAEGYVTRQGTPEQWDVTPAYRTPPTPAVADPLIPPPACERGTPRAEAAEQLTDGLWGGGERLGGRATGPRDLPPRDRERAGPSVRPRDRHSAGGEAVGGTSGADHFGCEDVAPRCARAGQP